MDKDNNEAIDYFEDIIDWNDFSIDEKFQIISKIYSEKVNLSADLSKEEIDQIKSLLPKRIQKLVQHYNQSTFEDVMMEHSNILYNSTFYYGDIALSKNFSEVLKSRRNDDYVFASSLLKLIVGSATMLYGAKHSNWPIIGIGGAISTFGTTGYFKPYLALRNQMDKISAKVQISKLNENLLATSHILNSKYNVDLQYLNDLLFKEIEIDYKSYIKPEEEEENNFDDDDSFYV